MQIYDRHANEVRDNSSLCFNAGALDYEIAFSNRPASDRDFEYHPDYIFEIGRVEDKLGKHTFYKSQTFPAGDIPELTLINMHGKIVTNIVTLSDADMMDKLYEALRNYLVSRFDKAFGLAK